MTRKPRYMILWIILIALSCESNTYKQQITTTQKDEVAHGTNKYTKDSVRIAKPTDDDQKEISEEDEYYKAFKKGFENDNELWGNGILSNLTGNSSGMINFPDSSINAYNKPKGGKIGKIIRTYKHQSAYNLYLHIDSGEKIRLDWKDIKEINYEGACLKYYDKKNGYVLCLINDYIGGVWLNINELMQYGFGPVNWETFLVDNNTCYFPLKTPMILLYNINEEVQDTIVRNKQVVKMTKEKHNGLIKVIIESPSELGNCSGQQIGTGWLKVIDENGHPTIWFYTRGC